MLSFSVPPDYVRTRLPVRPKLDPFSSFINRILQECKNRPKKRRQTSRPFSKHLRDGHGFADRITIVKDYNFGARQHQREMVAPLAQWILIQSS